MEFEHSFTIPVPPDRAWDVLLDVERVAPCMPGAAVDAVEGDDIKGRVRVKVGPITMTYQGSARFVDRDPDAHTVTLEASGRESRGSGTASATVHAALHGDNGQTRVTLDTTLNVTGRPAQMGRGVLAEVSGKLIEQFAANLAARLAGDTEPSRAPASAAAASGAPGAAGAATAADASGATVSGGSPAAGAGAAAPAPAAAADRTAPQDDTLNLLSVVAGPLIKRLLPAVGALAGALIVVLAVRRGLRRRRAS